MVNICGYVRESINEGDGLRTVIFFSGCHGMCDGCHNPESWDFNAGVEFSYPLQDKVIQEIKSNKLVQGVTYCGGEPFMSAKDVLEFTYRLKKHIPDISIWVYSGFTIEYIVDNPKMFALLKEIDVLIDGRFIEEQKDLTAKYTGSSNQRIIDVPKTLDKGEIVPYYK